MGFQHVLVRDIGIVLYGLSRYQTAKFLVIIGWTLCLSSMAIAKGNAQLTLVQVLRSRDVLSIGSFPA
jgi:hypothetical protein